MQYMAICQQLEHSVHHALAKKNKPFPVSHQGRGQTREVHFVQEYSQPPKRARTGEPQPGYHGPNLRHAQWIRQLRRLDNLVRLLRRNDLSMTKVEHRINLWHRFRTSSGFVPNSPLWWSQLSNNPVPVLPEWLPPLEVVDSIRQVMHTQLCALE